MISVSEARKIISDNITPLEAVPCPLEEAVGLVLANDVFASHNIPAFPQSSMDGYAFSFEDWNGKGLQIDGEMPAGISEKVIVKPGTAMRIFTGAPVPFGTDTVVMQEKTRNENNVLIIEDTGIKRGQNVRPEGSEIKAGDLALPAGVVLTPAAIGFLAAIGVKEIMAYPKPFIAIIITGNELQEPGLPLSYGQVYECNSLTLESVLSQLHFGEAAVTKAKDDLPYLKNALDVFLRACDIVLFTGGISAGDYDFVLQAANNCGVETKFHKIKQRPGKPLYFGTKGNKLVFGLPGNPSSVLTCFYEYVLPALYQLCNQQKSMQVLQASLANNFKKVKELTHFAKGYFDGKKVTILDAQESYRLSSFAKANCLVVLEEDRIVYEEEEMVDIHLLP